MDQGIKENHTATLHPCHGTGPQVTPDPRPNCLRVPLSPCLCFLFKPCTTHECLPHSDMIYSCVSHTGCNGILLGESSAVRKKMFPCCTFCAEVSQCQRFSLRGLSSQLTVVNECRAIPLKTHLSSQFQVFHLKKVVPRV